MIIHPKCLAHSGCLAFSINACMHAKSLQSCLILCDPIDCSPPGSSVHGILQARVLEWGAVSFSKGNQRSNLGPQQWKGGVLTTGPSGKSLFMYLGIKKKVKSEISKCYIGLC